MGRASGPDGGILALARAPAGATGILAGVGESGLEMPPAGPLPPWLAALFVSLTGMCVAGVHSDASPEWYAKGRTGVPPLVNGDATQTPRPRSQTAFAELGVSQRPLAFGTQCPGLSEFTTGPRFLF